MDTNRIRRHNRIRAKVIGTAARPRLCVYKSNRYLEAQLIDDTAGKTLASVKLADAQKAGEEIAKKGKAAGVEAVVFDRGGFRYIGKIAVLADAARKGGLTF
ncbi:50S ribosomal protein L18 [Candidatus Nomurabacteria bacterium]|nr:50S ribosomal protein L18 [Candidatus Nomurabacteria bacterium]